ncbi:MAG: hypothetical protein OSB39_10235 [Opitutales bacterium]|nr:hypothetical protein [Opitutales bacterium]
MSNNLIIKWKNRCGGSCILFLIAVLSLAFSSFAQDPESRKTPSAESTDSQKEKSDESESDSGEDASSNKEEGSGDNEQTPDSAGSTPVESEQNPSGGENVAPAGLPPSVPVPPPSLSFAVPDVAGKAFDVKRDSGTLEDLDKLSRVEGLLPDSTPPSGFSEEILNRDISLLTNHILSGVFPASARFEQSELDANDLALDVTSVWNHLSSATDSFPLVSYSSVVGRNLSLAEGTYGVESENAFLLGATSDLSYSGEVSFSGTASRVVLIGGSVVSAAAGSKLKLDAALTDLVVVSRSDWSVSDAAFAAGSKLYLRSLSDLNLNNVDFTATDLVRLEALMDLSLDSASFSAGLREIQMRATTIDLSNVDFPSSSIVQLHVMKGGLDGKYPTFGSSNRAYGRVNFLRNISYGGKANLLQDRSSFDLHGTNIKISKLP